MPEQKTKDVDHQKREQARRNLSTEFERLQESLKPVAEAFGKVKSAKFDDDMAALLGALGGAVNRAIRGGFFKGGVGAHAQDAAGVAQAQGKREEVAPLLPGPLIRHVVDGSGGPRWAPRSREGQAKLMIRN